MQRRKNKRTWMLFQRIEEWKLVNLHRVSKSNRQAFKLAKRTWEFNNGAKGKQKWKGNAKLPINDHTKRETRAYSTNWPNKTINFERFVDRFSYFKKIKSKLYCLNQQLQNREWELSKSKAKSWERSKKAGRRDKGINGELLKFEEYWKIKIRAWKTVWLCKRTE